MSRAIHKMRARQPLAVLIEDFGNVSSTGGTSVTFSSVAVGSGGGRTIILLTTSEDSDSTSREVASVTVDGNATTKVTDILVPGTGASNHSAIWILDLTTETGNVDIVLTANVNCDSWGLSFLVVTGLQSTTASDAATGSAVSTSVATSTTLDGPPGGIAVGVASHGNLNSHTWGSSMTERADLQTAGGASDHRHSMAYDLLPSGRSAATETVTSGSSNRFALATASFR